VEAASVCARTNVEKAVTTEAVVAVDAAASVEDESAPPVAVVTMTDEAGASEEEMDMVMGETRVRDSANGMLQLNTLQIGGMVSQGCEFTPRARTVLEAHLQTMTDNEEAVALKARLEGAVTLKEERVEEVLSWGALATQLKRRLEVVQVAGEGGVTIETHGDRSKGRTLPPLYFQEDQQQPDLCRRLQYRAVVEDQSAASPFTRYLRNGQMAGPLEKIEAGEWSNKLGTCPEDCKCNGREEEEIGCQAARLTRDIKLHGPRLAAAIGAHVVMLYGPEEAPTFRLHTAPPGDQTTICPHHQWVVYLWWPTEGQAGAGHGVGRETSAPPSPVATGAVVAAAVTGSEGGVATPTLVTSISSPPPSSEEGTIQVLLVTPYGRRRRGKWIQGPVVPDPEQPMSAEERKARANETEGGGGSHPRWLSLGPEESEQTRGELTLLTSMAAAEEEEEGGVLDLQRQLQGEALLSQMMAANRIAALTCAEGNWGNDLTAALFLRRESQNRGWHAKATLGPQQMSFITEGGDEKLDWRHPLRARDRLCPNQWQTVAWDQELLVMMVKPSSVHWIALGLYRCTKEVLIWDSIEGTKKKAGAQHWINAIIRLAGEMGHGAAWGAPWEWTSTRMEGPYQADGSSCAFFGIGTVVALLTNQDIEHNADNISLLRLAVARSIIDHGNHQGLWP
jgi:hypothetical protein